MVVSINLCAPGRTPCATFPNVMLDAGSTGLCIEASALPPLLHLPALLDHAGKPLVECLHFVHDVAWGPLVRADLHLGGEVAVDLPIQLISDEDQAQPANCPRSEAHPTANGTLGLGPNILDCASTCEQNPNRPGVFTREANTWTSIRGDVATAFVVCPDMKCFDRKRPPCEQLDDEKSQDERCDIFFTPCVFLGSRTLQFPAELPYFGVAEIPWSFNLIAGLAFVILWIFCVALHLRPVNEVDCGT